MRIKQDERKRKDRMATAAKPETSRPALRVYRGCDSSIDSSATAAGMIACYTRKHLILSPPSLATIAWAAAAVRRQGAAVPRGDLDASGG